MFCVVFRGRFKSTPKNTQNTQNTQKTGFASQQSAWRMERARSSFDSYLQDEVECVASHFLVVGLQPGLLQPLLPVEQGCDDVLTDVRIVLPSKGEECPPGYTLIESTPDGQRASLNHGDVLGAPVFLAVCTEPITRCGASRRPITAVQAIHVDRGERAAPGFTPITSTVGGHEANLNYGGTGRDIQLCVERAADKVPLCRLEVLVRSRGGLRVPRGCLLMRGDDGKPRNLNAGSLGSTVFLAFERARPTALLQTPLQPTILDVLAASDRPQPRQPPNAQAPPRDAEARSVRTSPGEGGEAASALARATRSARSLSRDGGEDGGEDGDEDGDDDGFAAS